ncbi:hypothetical protein MMC14_000725 [Varicellaria rhodocarpa]|nr:hypothetical protein [Varicellaria rhodocarpa]
MQRLALLPIALGRSPPDPDEIYEAMKDKLHQPYRKSLIPGLTEVFESLHPKTHIGLLGVCLSGAGPTILALATDHFELVAESIISSLSKFEAGGIPITCTWKLLDIAENGATVTGSFGSS